MKFFTRLFGRSKDLQVDPFEIIGAYGSVLEKPGPTLGGARSVDDLPYEKDVIKSAIFEVSNLHRDNSQVMDSLETAYLSLAYFQSNVEARKLKSGDLDKLIQELQGDGDIKDIAIKIESLTGDIDRHSPAIQSEMQRLQEEWNREVAR